MKLLGFSSSFEKNSKFYLEIKICFAMEAADGFNRNGLADDQFGDLYKFPRNLGYR